MKNYFKNLTVKRALAWTVVFAVCAFVFAEWYILPIVDFFRVFDVSIVMGIVFVIAWTIGVSIILFVCLFIVLWALSELNKI